MDKRAIKRLAVIVAASLVAIALLKVGLLKTYSALNKAAAEKKQAATARPVVPPQAQSTPAFSEVNETPAASSVTLTTEDTPAATGRNETE